MRELIYVPIVHTAADMGSLLPAAKAEFLRKYGEREWKEHNKVIQSFWEGLRGRITGLNLDYAHTYLYQDGLPACGKEMDIVRELARQGNQNHRLLLWLVEQGATLVGTESPELLLAEYELMRNLLSATGGSRRQVDLQTYKGRAKELLSRRDEYIRHRIRDTLPENWKGLLFIGLMHRVEEGLPQDISVSYLIHRLPFRRAADVGQFLDEEET